MVLERRLSKKLGLVTNLCDGSWLVITLKVSSGSIGLEGYRNTGTGYRATGV